MSISVIVPSCGRSTLEYTVQSIINQLLPGDELIVVGPRKPEVLVPKWDFRDDFKFVHRDNGGCDPVTMKSLSTEPGYPSGAVERDMGRAVATGSHLMVIDDDDIYLPNALELAREAIRKQSLLVVASGEAPPIHIFRMQYGYQKQWKSHFSKDMTDRRVWRGRDPEEVWVLWGDPIMEIGNIGGSMSVYPNNELLGKWDCAGGLKNVAEDFHIVANYNAAAKVRPVFHPEVNSIVKPTPQQIADHLGLPRPAFIQYAPQAVVNWDGRVE
jgi:hypothetical protein